MVYAGANDGMLHAFYLGKLELDGIWNVDPNKLYKKASLTDPSNVGRGKEVWSFIPKNVLPYLKHIADPNYCHIYSVDLSPYVFDASIGAPGSGDISNNVKDVNSWRTILIGGMRVGGACRKSDAVCSNCVKAPGVDLDGGGVTTDEEKSLGLSTYFALDITNSLNHPEDPASYPPQLLWEFSDPSLGFTSTGTSIVKINMKSDDSNSDGKFDGLDPSATTKNGKWFVVFGSGPTGPVSTADHQFLGRSDQNLKLFIIDLKNGPVAGSIWTKTTAEANAFAGSMINSTFDIDTDYQDDVVYVPYVKETGGTWTAGGVGRLLTREDLNPANWEWSKVIEGIGPVTSAVAKLQDKRRGQLWLFFGTGRYYFEQEPPDDREGQQAIYGIKDPCYSIFKPNFELTAACPALGGLTDVTDIGDVPTDYTVINAMNGWFIDLNSCSDSAGTEITPADCASSSVGYRTERMITDPLATTLGVVFFTTFKPKDNFCEPGGLSYIWASKYNTGGAAAGLLKGKAILQVSTGKIEEVDLQSQFGEEGGRRSSGMEGVPPTAQGLSLITSPPPVKRTIHMRER
ncbi:MAG: hypothetical protein A2X59_06785 [Nitrospirae bacterium GWC2_42_7]|nr:MAG: hypothetical protein A2X59_06785 [Nitrospirae bacterium GWC2_42_7]